MELPNVKKDFLTNFYIKEDMETIIDKVIAECKTEGKPFSLLVMDLDHFRSYNYKFGHLDGDSLLQYFASTVRLSLEEEKCIPIRFGGDEFIVIFPGKYPAQARVSAVRLAKVLHKRPFLTRGKLIKVSFSGGIVSYPKDGDNEKMLLERADRSMYFSKLLGRGRTILYSNIFLSVALRVLIIALAITLLTSLIYYRKYLSKDQIAYYLRNAQRWFMNVPAAAIDDSLSGKDIIYLRSGGVLKGRIVRSDKESVKIKIASGEAEVVVRRSDIKNIVTGGKNESDHRQDNH